MNNHQQKSTQQSIKMLPIILLAVVVVLIVFYFQNTFTYWERKKIPSYPSPSLITGHSKSNFANQIVDMYKYFKNKGLKHGGFYIFHQPIYMPMDLDLLRQIITKDFDHFNEKGLYNNEKDQPINMHLFALGGNRWKKLRVKLTPTFTSGKLKNMFPTMLDCSKPLLKAIEKSTKSKTVIDIKDVASKFTTDIIGSCAFGIECDSFNDQKSEFHENGKKLLTRSKLGLFKRAMGLSFPKLCRFVGMVQLPRDLEAFYTNITKDTIKLREENNIHRNDFLELLMTMRDKANPEERINLQEIINQSFVFYVAGFETSSSVMTYALLELSRNAEMQDKVRQEITDVLKKYNNEITYDAVHDMKYLGQVIDETLRMYPPVLVLNRACNKDYPIPGTDRVLEKDTKVFIPVLAIHHDEEFYPNPEKFDPERFSDENKKERHPYAFLPFGEGPRQCIGLRFGYIQTKIGLLTMLKQFKFTLHPSVSYPIRFDKGLIALSPAETILLNSTPI